MKTFHVFSRPYSSNKGFISVNLSLSLPVIVLDDVTHSPDSCQVFIKALRVDVMEGHRGPGVPVGASKINSNLARGCREYEIR